MSHGVACRWWHVVVPLLVVGCATAVGRAAFDPPPTIRITNFSGGVVQVYIRDVGAPRSLGRIGAEGGCIHLRRVPYSAVNIGLRHQASRVIVWSAPHQLGDRSGWSMEVGQPNTARWDVERIIPARRCT